MSEKDERGLCLGFAHSPSYFSYSQAYATRADLGSQRATLSDMSKRMSDTASRIPGLNNVIRLISRRRQRDRVIMGIVIGTCTVLFFMYLVR